MIKKFTMIFLMLFAVFANCNCFGSSSSNNLNIAETEVDLYSLEANENFIVDFENSTNDVVRLCVPIHYPRWFCVPASSISTLSVKHEKSVGNKKYGFATVDFKTEYNQFNTILSSVQDLIHEELSINNPSADLNFGWSPPWRWSGCAKCKLSVNAFISGTVLVAAVAAGTTGPGALAVCESLIAGAYGAAAWEAVKAVIFRPSVSEIARKICSAKGDC